MSTHVWRRIEDVGNDEENIEEVVEEEEMSTTDVVVVDGDGPVEEEDSLKFNLTIL